MSDAKLAEALREIGVSEKNTQVILELAHDASQRSDGWIRVEERLPELVRRMTSAMRSADKAFESVGGGTRHHVRECLLPILEEHGLRLELLPPAPTKPNHNEN